MKIYRGGRRFPDRGRGPQPPRQGASGRRLWETERRGGYRRRSHRRRLVFTVVGALLLLLLLYLILPFWTTRTVLMGSDARSGDEFSRADTIMVAAAGWQDGMLSVPRDSLVEIPGHGQDKINSAFAYGGPDLAVETLEDFTGVGIGDYAVINFGGVEDIVNAMGGITINVEEEIYLGIEGQRYHIEPGEQELDGGEALAYTRYRGGPDADIGRIGRQQEFIKAASRQMLSPAKWPRIPAVALAVYRNVDTNMNPLQMARFGVQMVLAGDMNVETYPGTPQYIDGISYWVPDTEAGQQTVDETIK